MYWLLQRNFKHNIIILIFFLYLRELHYKYNNVYTKHAKPSLIRCVRDAQAFLKTCCTFLLPQVGKDCLHPIANLVQCRRF